ncbi:hypothetical protein F4780DRAFT_490757 [Xylariomycetidae sp. FL0641]|nr:hypothetical protein F4780DRAFT_490757 [Xylariomycetidae sp. FL0641]
MKFASAAVLLVAGLVPVLALPSSSDSFPPLVEKRCVGSGGSCAISSDCCAGICICQGGCDCLGFQEARELLDEMSQ